MHEVYVVILMYWSVHIELQALESLNTVSIADYK